jgi:hypothetical protein
MGHMVFFTMHLIRPWKNEEDRPPVHSKPQPSFKLKLSYGCAALAAKTLHRSGCDPFFYLFDDSNMPRSLISLSPIFLPVWRFKQIAITSFLNPNKLRWVCDDKGYALIRFEAIPRMLIFELKFDPWSRF